MQKINETNFESEVLNSTQPVLVTFYASWCGTRRLTSMVEQLTCELDGIAKVVKIDVEESPNLATRYNVHNLPYFAVVDHGMVKEINKLQRVH